MPNDLGLFDMLGNVDEWCQERSSAGDPAAAAANAVLDERLDNKQERDLRGGSFNYQSEYMRSSYLHVNYPTNMSPYNGFRVARTLR